MESSTPEKRLSEEQRDGYREFDNSIGGFSDSYYNENPQGPVPFSDYSEGFRCGLVIPATESRLENLEAVLKSVSEGTLVPVDIVVVCDGWWVHQQAGFQFAYENLPTIKFVHIDKHEPGKEQPRNVGVRYLNKRCNYVWFLDSDCLVQPDTLENYKKAHESQTAYQRVLIGPYDWMGPGERTINPVHHNDPRWEMFENTDERKVFIGNLGVALGCFSGNLVWPIPEFKRVGGFWKDLHMGRCEDGELGIRAAAMCVPMQLVKTARAYHMEHPIDHAAIQEKNTRDVPMINERHPYVEGQGLVVADYDGKRFDYICDECGEQINTIESWTHGEKCHGKPYL